MYGSLIIILALALTVFGGRRAEAQTHHKQMEYATLGAGCFWCVEAVFQRVRGVISVEPGYAGGHVPNPTYEQVCTGRTGHAEVARITYDPTIVSFKTLLDIFWHTHNPTTPNRQGADVGTQYRSVIFYENEQQRKVAAESKSLIDASGLWDKPVITEMEPLKNFYKAENYHQNYFNNHSNAPYCSVVIAPKLTKFEKEFPDLFREAEHQK
ncbi:MAG TPA: peptide-methionine (S)-S-oxide reductase MsrA [Balneolales bacterium]|nr:peptide-methionine (S)-S-oxide reductase MsrA [Balneolales bacterium]